MLAEILVRSGIGKVYLCDNGIIEKPDLNRQIFYTQKDIGKRKVDIATKRLSEILQRTFPPVSRIYKDSCTYCLPQCRLERLSRPCCDGGRSGSEYSSFRLHGHHETFRVENNPHHRLSLVHTTIPAKHGKPDAKEPNPGSRSTLPYYRKKEIK